MRIGILKVDSVHEELSAEHNDYDQMFAALFGEVRPTWSMRVYDVLKLELPQELEECDGFLITGSQYSTYEDLPWIPTLEKFIQRCHGAQKKLLGICFGHQIIAQALGGESSFSDRGWGVGVIAHNIDEPLFFLGHKPDDFRIIYSHQDQVKKLPEGAKRLGGNDHCPIGMYQIGRHIWCCQGHPEFYEAYVEALFLRREEKLGREKMREAIASLKNGTNRFEVGEWMARFFETA